MHKANCIRKLPIPQTDSCKPVIVNRDGEKYITYNDSDGKPIRLTNLESLFESIITTNSRYVYPIIYTTFVKHELNTTGIIRFSDNDLDVIRTWSNQIRELYSVDNRETCFRLCYDVALFILRTSYNSSCYNGSFRRRRT